MAPLDPCTPADTGPAADIRTAAAQNPEAAAGIAVDEGEGAVVPRCHRNAAQSWHPACQNQPIAIRLVRQTPGEAQSFGFSSSASLDSDFSASSADSSATSSAAASITSAPSTAPTPPTDSAASSVACPRLIARLPPPRPRRSPRSPTLPPRVRRSPRSPTLPHRLAGVLGRRLCVDGFLGAFIGDLVGDFSGFLGALNCGLVNLGRGLLRLNHLVALNRTHTTDRLRCLFGDAVLGRLLGFHLCGLARLRAR